MGEVGSGGRQMGVSIDFRYFQATDTTSNVVEEMSGNVGSLGSQFKTNFGYFQDDDATSSRVSEELEQVGFLEMWMGNLISTLRTSWQGPVGRGRRGRSGTPACSSGLGAR